jgi:SHOCT-like domain
MRDELATILRLVSEGTLSADEAAPIIEALTRSAGAHGRASEPSVASAATSESGRGPNRGRKVRIQVSERGHKVVDVRIPLAFAAMAARMVPGLPDRYASLIEQAVNTDTIGPIVDTEDEDGDAVLISVE